MAKPNENFKLSVRDIELIEQALFLAQSNADDKLQHEIQNLRAKLHHQKMWYRHSKEVYVSG